MAESYDHLMDSGEPRELGTSKTEIYSKEVADPELANKRESKPMDYKYNSDSNKQLFSKQQAKDWTSNR